MTPNGVLMVTALKPAAIAISAVLVLALLATVVLTIVIKRREAARYKAAMRIPTTPVQTQRIQRATSNNLPDDMQERLRYLTGADKVLDRDEQDDVAPAAPSAPPAPRPAMADDTTHYFDDTTPAAVESFEGTHVFGDAATTGADGDRTHVFGGQDATGFFGDHAATDATAFFGDEPGGDATAFFGDEPGGDATAFFGEEPGGDATGFFGEERQSRCAAPQEREDATRFFGSDTDDAAEDVPSGTDFFTAGDLAGPDVDDDLRQDHTGMLQALPPASFPAPTADAGRLDGDQLTTNDRVTGQPALDSPAAGAPTTADPAAGAADLAHQFTVAEPQGAAASLDAIDLSDLDLDATFGGTAPLQALPPSQPIGPTGALDRVRERLASFAEPRVIALSVLDGSGRVVAGDTDDDLAGELRSLMAESGSGNAADVDQAVQLDDNTAGALLLLPTGANALLGALVRDDDDGQATRAHLRGLAHEIGDAMQRAS